MKDTFDIIGFIDAIGKVRLAFLNSPTKGVAVFEIMVLHGTSKNGMLEDLLTYISNYSHSNKNPQNVNSLKDLETGIRFIANYLKDERALKILKQARDAVIDEISTGLLASTLQIHS